jgi:diguanylate cyclase (GGDEF)-like protein
MKYAYDIFHESGKTLDKHAIFFIDLDNFKNVNDTLGHDYGDMLLKQVADHLTDCVTSEDILARTGGDEFLILKKDATSKDELVEFSSSLTDIAKKPFNLDGEMAHVSMSVGIAVFPDDGLSITELIKNADIAMYYAKTSGKNGFSFFNSYMEDDVNKKTELADVLTTVIEKGEVYLQYQPQVNVETGRITGHEALMRIESDLLGFIPPTEFIPVAEDTGIINELGEWALYDACFRKYFDCTVKGQQSHFND